MCLDHCKRSCKWASGLFFFLYIYIYICFLMCLYSGLFVFSPSVGCVLIGYAQQVPQPPGALVLISVIYLFFYFYFNLLKKKNFFPFFIAFTICIGMPYDIVKSQRYFFFFPSFFLITPPPLFFFSFYYYFFLFPPPLPLPSFFCVWPAPKQLLLTFVRLCIKCVMRIYLCFTGCVKAENEDHFTVAQ